MTPRIDRLRQRSFDARPAVSIERALIETRFYETHLGKHSTPELRALFFKSLCEQKRIVIAADELIVGERGPAAKVVPTFPELTCHSAEDLRILDRRAMTGYQVAEADIQAYEAQVIPFWQGRTMRDRVFDQVPDQWQAAYRAGMFTEFMEQRAPGHTALDGAIYRKGMRDYKAEIAEDRPPGLPRTTRRPRPRPSSSQAMDIACDAAVIFARRHARSGRLDG
jgi:pyruvate-formate lyase